MFIIPPIAITLFRSFGYTCAQPWIFRPFLPGWRDFRIRRAYLAELPIRPIRGLGQGRLAVGAGCEALATPSPLADDFSPEDDRPDTAFGWGDFANTSNSPIVNSARLPPPRMGLCAWRDRAEKTRSRAYGTLPPVCAQFAYGGRR